MKIEEALDKLEPGNLIEFRYAPNGSIKGSRCILAKYLIHDNESRQMRVEDIFMPLNFDLGEMLPECGDLLATGYVNYHEIKSLDRFAIEELFKGKC
jgi:hypothetical protein